MACVCKNGPESCLYHWYWLWHKAPVSALNSEFSLFSNYTGLNARKTSNRNLNNIPVCEYEEFTWCWETAAACADHLHTWLHTTSHQTHPDSVCRNQNLQILNLKEIFDKFFILTQRMIAASILPHNWLIISARIGRPIFLTEMFYTITNTFCLADSGLTQVTSLTLTFSQSGKLQRVGNGFPINLWFCSFFVW